MATERQIAANRRNARKSTGPRSSAAKRRTSRNSYSHGLTASVISNAERTKRIERLACKIAGKAADVVTLEYARDAAQAEFELAQIRRLKVALIERIMALGELQVPQTSKSVSDETIPERAGSGRGDHAVNGTRALGRSGAARIAGTAHA